MRPTKRTLERIPLGHLGYWAAALAVVVMGWSLYAAKSREAAAHSKVAQTFEVLADIGRFGELAGRAEAAQRGFLLTAEDRFLTERDEAIAQMGLALDRVKALTAENPGQAQRLQALEGLLAQRVELMRENSARRRASPSDATRAVASGRGQQLSARIKAATEEVRAEEGRQLQARREAEATDARHSVLTIAATVLLSLALLVPSYVAYLNASRARHLAEVRLLDLANSLPGALYRLRRLPDGARRFEFLSSGVETLRGVDREAAMRDFGMMWETIFEEDRAGVDDAMSRAERELRPVSYEFRVKMPGGALRWLRASATLRKERDGSVLWNGYWSDVTREKELQRALEEARDGADAANRAKSTFLATMSHEIRTPMNGVLGMLELLALTRLDNEQRTTLGIIRESGRSLLRIIDDILDFSKIEAGKLDVRPEVASVRNLVERVCDIYSGNASSKGLVLKRYVDGRLHDAVMVDPLRLQQILNNFVSNAIKFTDKGVVELRAELAASDGKTDIARFSVHDTGIGVSEAERARLFTPFAQATDSTSQRYGGTGLGLSICRRLATMMGGSISMESAVGRGTVMTLTLPLPIVEAGTETIQTEHQQPVVPAVERRLAAPPVEAARRDNLLVLLVDDHPINRMVLLKQINTLGYAAEVAQNGLEAIDQWSRGGVGCILTDCNMPEMNGYELARHIRQCEQRNGHARVPIVACTANALGGEAENCFAAGMDDYLAKPIDLRRLAQKLSQWLPLPVQGGVLDAAVLAEISGGDAAVEADLLGRFGRFNSEDAAALARALEDRDCAAVAQASHRIKGASRAIGATRLADACERLERASRAEDWEAVLAAATPFRSELASLEAHIASWRIDSPQRAVNAPAPMR